MTKKDLFLTSIELAVCFVFGFSVFSCASNRLYSWYNYQDAYSSYVKKYDENSIQALMKTYEKIINEQKDIRGVVPPGIYADYGWFLIENGKKEEGKAMLAKEVELYPESAILVKGILKRME